MTPEMQMMVLDRLIGALITFANATGAAKLVSDVIARRLNELRDWTDEERQAVTDAMHRARAYAQAEVAKPDQPKSILEGKLK